MKESMSCAKTVAWNLIPDDIKKKINTGTYLLDNLFFLIHVLL